MTGWKIMAALSFLGGGSAYFAQIGSAADLIGAAEGVAGASGHAQNFTVPGLLFAITVICMLMVFYLYRQGLQNQAKYEEIAERAVAAIELANERGREQVDSMRQINASFLTFSAQMQEQSRIMAACRITRSGGAS